MQIGDQVEYRENGLQRHTIYAIDGNFIRACRQQLNDTDGYSAFYITDSVKVIRKPKLGITMSEQVKERYIEQTLDL